MPQSPENVKLSAKDSGADIREVNPMEITPPNRVTSSSKCHYLINEFENNGYNGRNVVLALLDATGDEERARIADGLYEDGIIPKEARDLLVREDELNFENA